MIIIRAVGGSQNQGGQYRRTYFGLYQSIPTPIKIKICFQNLSEFIGFFKFKFRIIRPLHKYVQRDVLRFPPKNWVGNCPPCPLNSYGPVLF